MKKQFLLTKDGVKELETELASLIAERSVIAERIKTAREFGDLSENAEYQTARQEQERLESRVSELENILQNVEIIKKPSGAKKVQIGTTVKLANNGKTKVFTVVGTVEADPANGKISDESPIGKAIMGKSVGDKVEIVTPAETTVYKVSEIV